MLGWDANVQDEGGDQKSLAGKAASGVPVEDLEGICAFKHQRISVLQIKRVGLALRVERRAVRLEHQRA